MIARILLGVLFSASAFAATPGFEAGNQFSVFALRGELEVQCNPGGLQHQFCDGAGISPTATSKFATSAGTAGDQVALVATWASGKKVSKSAQFDSGSGKSKDEFNLLISTLFQTPLLGMGVNQIHYVITKKGAVQSSGDFDVTVAQGPDQTCPLGFENGGMGADCHNQAMECDTYFDQQLDAGACH